MDEFAGCSSQRCLLLDLVQFLVLNDHALFSLPRLRGLDGAKHVDDLDRDRNKV